MHNLLFDRNPVPMWFYDLASLHFLKVNDAAIHKYGYSRSEFLDMTILDIRPAEERKQITSFISRRRSDFTSAGEWTHLTKTGQKLRVLITSEDTVLDGINARIVQALDVTRERELEKSGSRLAMLNEKLIENLPDVFFLLDEERRVLQWNHNFEAISGFKPEQIYRMKAEDFFQDKELERIQNAFEILKKEKSVRLEANFTHRNGQKIPASFSASCFTAGNDTYFTGVAQDLRQLRSLEEQATEDERRFRETFEQSVFGLAHVGRDGKVQWVNDCLAKMVGSSTQCIMQLRVQDVVEPADSYAERRAIAKLLKGRTDRVTYTKQVVKKNGNPIWVKVTASTVFKEPHEIDFFVVVVEDINEKVALQLAYKETHQLLQRTFDSIGDAILVMDLYGRKIINVNREATRLLQYSREELIGATTSLVYPDNASFRQMGNQVLQQMSSNDSATLDAEMQRKDGSMFTGRITLSKVKENGKWLGKLVCAVRDVTEELRLQNELRISQARLNAAQRIARLGHWSNNMKDKELTWSEEVRRIFGVDMDFKASFRRFMAFVHPDDRPAVSTYLSGLSEGGPSEIEHRIVRPDGEIRCVLERAEMKYDAEGEPSWILGTVQDITHQKRHEKELEETLRDKNLILAEMHHRVKNNMALVSALLYLQSTEIEHPEVQQMLESSQSRIKSIASVHEQLYHSKKLTHIPLGAVIHTILNNIADTLEPSLIKVEEVDININQAIPLALFLNELFYYLANKRNLILPQELNRLEIQLIDNELMLFLELAGEKGLLALADFVQERSGHLVAHTLLRQLEATMTIRDHILQIRFELDERRGSANAMAVHG